MQFLRRRHVLSGYIARVAAVMGGALALTVWLALPASASIGNLGPGSSGSQVKIWQQDLNFFIGTENTCHPTLTVGLAVLIACAARGVSPTSARKVFSPVGSSSTASRHPS